MRSIEFDTVDVFTGRRFGGNPLAVFPDARGLDDAMMQALAAEMNLSETTFVLPAADPANTARVRIFNRKEEMAFAGHPSIGTAFTLARRSGGAPERMSLEVPAGIVEVLLSKDDTGRINGARTQVPQALLRGEEIPTAQVAECLGLALGDVATSNHPPVVASAGNPYVIAELSPDALVSCEPDQAAFRRALAARPHLGTRFSIYCYSRSGGNARARIFAPLAGTIEDPATGSAAAPLAGLLLSLSAESSLEIQIAQGVEMGRPSLIRAFATRDGGSVATGVAGECVPVFSGSFGWEGR